jgi:hypothetical protein
MVRGFDHPSSQHPEFKSVEVTKDGTSIPVTLFSYQRFKFKLYKIASPILENVRFFYGTDKAQVVEKIEKVHQELLSWFASLPQELSLDGTQDIPESPSTAVEKTYRLQALALQLAYDNIMILLHRPLLLADSALHVHAMTEHIQSPNTAEGMLLDMQRAQSVSKNQCWESALRTSKVVEHMDILRVVQTTHAASYTGMHMYTAGMMLSIVALSQPTSPQAQEAKRAIGGMVRLLNAFGPITALSAQSGTILQDLLKLIMTKEIEELVAEPRNAQGIRNMLGPGDSGPTIPIGSSKRTENRSMNSYRSPTCQAGHAPSLQDSQLITCQPSISANTGMHLDQTISDTLGYTDFNPGILSLQEGESPSFVLWLSGDQHLNNGIRSYSRSPRPKLDCR